MAMSFKASIFYSINCKMLPVKSGFCIWIKTFQIIFHFMATAVNFICGHEYEQAWNLSNIKNMKSAKTESTEELIA